MKPGKRKRHFVLNFFSCFLIPVYTISFAGSTEWFGSNFSVIAVTGWDHYRGFLYWGLLAVLLILRRQRPERYGRLLIAWGLIVLGSAVLFLIPRMVSSALEVFFTISAALLAQKLYMLRQGEL